MSRQQIATDTFTYSNGGINAVSGGNWRGTNNFNGEVQVSGNMVIGGNLQATATRWEGSGSFNNDQYAKAKIVSGLDGFSTRWSGVACRISTDNDDGNTNTRDHYMFQVQCAAGGSGGLAPYELTKVIDGTSTVIASGNQIFSHGDTIEIEAEGTTIRGMRNGSLVASATDSALSTGKPGLAGITGNTDWQIDDWEGGNIIVGDVTLAVIGSASTGGSGTAVPGIAIGL